MINEINAKRKQTIIVAKCSFEFSPPVVKKPKLDITAKAKRWTWKERMIVALIENLNEYKTQEAFESYDFEADLVTLYGDLGKMMAERYPDFGP